jgi:hypothetical protein
MAGMGDLGRKGNIFKLKSSIMMILNEFAKKSIE